MNNEKIHYLNNLLDYLKMNAKQFSESLGFDRVDRLYNILNFKNKISPDLAKIITSKYEEVNYEWLLKGDGVMIKDSSQKIKENSIGVGNFNTGDNPTFHTYPITEFLGYQEIIKTHLKQMEKLLNIIDKLTEKHEK